MLALAAAHLLEQDAARRRRVATGRTCPPPHADLAPPPRPCATTGHLPPSVLCHHPRIPSTDTRTIRHRATTGHVPPPADTRTTRGYSHHLSLCPHHTNARSPRVICKSMACTSVPPQSFIIIPSRRAEYPPPRQSRYWFIPNKRRSTTTTKTLRPPPRARPPLRPAHAPHARPAPLLVLVLLLVLAAASRQCSPCCASGRHMLVSWVCKNEKPAVSRAAAAPRRPN